MKTFQSALLVFVLSLFFDDVDAFWRMVCGTIQMGRIDPIINPGAIAGHCHTVAGPNNFNTTSTWESYQAAYCTSCSIQKDKSAYWTPQLYYRHTNGMFEEVPHDGTVVYYLDRGVGAANMTAFPPGYRVLAGDPALRAYDANTLTYGNKQYGSEPVANRVSYACLDSSGPMPETPGFNRMKCSSGLRAQIQFPSCWDGVNLYKSDQSHVAHLSGIDNGICPPTHPKTFPHLFFEVIYSVNSIDQSDGGYFVFSNGDTTGYGFHGDFQNGWDVDVLDAAISQCMGPNATNGGQIGLCPPLAASVDPFFSRNCPEQPPLVNETTKGMLKVLPGCNPPTGGPQRAQQNICPVQPALNYVDNQDYKSRSKPIPGDNVANFTYQGCAFDTGQPRPLAGLSYSNQTGMTINSCTAFCRKNGYAMAGLEYASQCYCASALSRELQSPLVCSAQSAMICTGDSFQFCGGQGMMHIWQDDQYTGPALKGLPVADVTTLPLPGGENATYRGCYKEGTGARALTGTSYSNNTGMSLESCAASCKRGNFALFGTEYGQECYCGNTITTEKVLQGNCSVICSGDKTEFCGGGSRLSVWSLGSYTPSSSSSTTGPASNPTGSQSSTTSASATPLPSASGVSYLDCYSETQGGRALSQLFTTSGQMTVDLCAQKAQALNLPFFGLEFASQCLAGNVINAASSILQSTKCNMACSGNAQQTCGGPNAISMYNNTLYVKPRNPDPVNVPNQAGVQYGYYGCYAEPGTSRALGSTSSQNSFAAESSSLTVEACAALCFAKGYNWMGVENGNQCFCNGAGVINGAANLTDADCSTTCVGDPKQNCGGTAKLNVYQLKSGTSRFGTRPGSGGGGGGGGSATTTTTTKKPNTSSSKPLPTATTFVTSSKRPTRRYRTW